MKTFKKLICTILAAVSVLSILDPFFENVSAKEYVNLSDYSQYISLASNEKLTSNRGYIEDGVLYYNVDKTTYEVTGQYYKFGSWSSWSSYSTTYQRAYSQNANTYNGDSVTEKEVRTYQEYRYATRSLKYTYTINLYKKVNGRYQYKTRTSSSGYPWVWDLQILGWKISSKYASSYYTSWSYGSWQKSTRATSNLVSKVGERTQYSYRTRTGTWTNKYGYVTRTNQKSARVYCTVSAGNPVHAITRFNSSDGYNTYESYYFKAGDIRSILESRFEDLLCEEDIAWYYELKNLVNSFFEVAALYGDELFNEQYISEDTLEEVPAAIIDLIFCAYPKNRINQIMGVVNTAFYLIDDYQSYRIVEMIGEFKKTLARAKDTDTIEICFTTQTTKYGAPCTDFNMYISSSDRIYAENNSTRSITDSTTVGYTNYVDLLNWYEKSKNYYDIPTFLRLGREAGIGEAYSLKEFIRLSIGDATGVYLHPTIMDGGIFALSLILEELMNGNTLMPANMIEELKNSNAKYTEKDVLMITKNSDGMLMWLEKGNQNSGLTHILDHLQDFINANVVSSADDIPYLLQKILQTSPVSLELEGRGYTAVYNYLGNLYTIGYGTNGYIVTFFISNH